MDQLPKVVCSETPRSLRVHDSSVGIPGLSSLHSACCHMQATQVGAPVAQPPFPKILSLYVDYMHKMLCVTCTQEDAAALQALQVRFLLDPWCRGGDLCGHLLPLFSTNPRVLFCT
jgi:hypothetical protein